MIIEHNTPIVNLKDEMWNIRKELKTIWEVVKNLKDIYCLPNSTCSEDCSRVNATQIIVWANADVSETIENLVLSYRHVEDAAMRLWKVIQADAWGVSIYDNKPEQWERIPWTYTEKL